MNKVTFVFLISLIGLSSCVSKKKFTSLQGEKAKTEMSLKEAMDRIKELQSERTADVDKLSRSLRNKEAEIVRGNARIDAMKEQINTLNNTNNRLLDQMSTNQLTSKAEAESIAASLQKINSQSQYIEKLNGIIRVKDSTNVALVYNLKKSLEDINDEDIDVEVKGTKVFVSISDKLLFSSGQAVISAKAYDILKKVAKVVKDNPELEVTVEGHTDNVPVSGGGKFADNWELSTARATAVVKDLASKFGVNPSRLSAAGRGEYVPKADNTTPEGRAINRRTEIILTPKLDQFFKLLEAPNLD